jgi:hypothetical protein
MARHDPPPLAKVAGLFHARSGGLTKLAVLDDKGLWRASPNVNYSQLPCPCAHVILRSCVCDVTSPAMFPSSRGLSCGQVFESIELTDDVSWPLDAVRMQLYSLSGDGGALGLVSRHGRPFRGASHRR